MSQGEPTNQGDERPVVVGVDGSGGAVKALEWALDEAGRRQAPLTLVYGWSLEPPDTLGTFRPHGEAVLDQAMALVAGRPGPPVQVTTEQVSIPAAEALVEASQGAQLLVVGSRGRGGFKGLLLGSVSQQCSQHARCPVVIVPPDRDVEDS